MGKIPCMEEGIFEQVADSRQDRKVKHTVSEILTVVMCGVSAEEREYLWNSGVRTTERRLAA